ncbi:Na/Pi cotransporter family protein [Oscillospiraceae bacterium NSJ-64]|uniref:Na/Pi cotransporter family protein n=2 Tax=Youxingia wuxianensis TaxID=2763678 RepID=A0A926ERV1_9FIRM|nr:Na/Pi cotransporter family protein [Youxingia wuxianensis]
MSILGTGLERVSGGRLEKTLEALTNTVIKGVLLGALVTGAIQSSSATTVIVVGLVNARVLKLRNAIGVIMGANIGTTITAHIIRLTDLESSNFLLMILKPTTLAPLASIVGIILFMASKRGRRQDIGQILLGFGILFTGMFAMEEAVRPLGEVPAFQQLFSTFANPVIGVLVGAVVTAVIQSSSASVGILQALSSTGHITYAMAFPIIMGQNIGTTITPILASIGASKNAKRAAAIHVSFNILGTIIFLIGCYTIQYTIGFPFWDQAIDKGGIANFHTIFNVVVTMLFIPFAWVLEKIACALVKDSPDDAVQDVTAIELDERLMISPGLAVDHARSAVVEMALIAQHNFINSIGLLENYDFKVVERINENENVLDKLEDRLETYLVKLSEYELSESDSRNVTELLHISGEFERIGDHATNIMESAQRLFETKTTFSKKATEELHMLCEAINEIIDLAIDAFQNRNVYSAASIEPLEEVIDEIEQSLKDKHINRLRKGKCTVEAAFPYVETLSNLERIADHCSNVGISVITYADDDMAMIDRHDYLRQLHKGQTEDYQEKYAVYSAKFLPKTKK